jgi:hypothetical protein
MKNIFVAVAVTAFFIYGCDNAKTNDTSSQNVIPESTTAQTEIIPSDSATQSIAPPPEVIQTVQAPAPSNPSTTAEGMNPAHGQPGHRCDIAVGAPLSSPPGPATPPAVSNPALQPANPSISIPPPTPTTPAIPTAAGMNPPHGQPGHDCAIPVGSPLKK